MNQKTKRFIILLLFILLCLAFYLILCPVRTLGEVLALKNRSIYAENCQAVSVFPSVLPGLEEDCLSVSSKLPHDTLIDLENQAKDDFFSLFSSLVVRKKPGKYHEFSYAHRQENNYSYIIFFHGSFYLSVCLCSEELCFASDPKTRYASFDYNTYRLVDCPENEAILDELLNLLTEKDSVQL